MEPNKDHHIQETLQKVLSHRFNLYNANTLEEQIAAIRDKRDHSFVVGYYLTAHYDEKILKQEIKKLKKSPNPHKFIFEQLKKIFSEPEKVQRFQEIFTYYIIELPIIYSRKPWRVGFSMSMNLKKIFKLVIKSANILNIKLEKVPKENYKLRCLLQESNAKINNEFFYIEVFDNTDEYLIDFVNENLSNIKFVLVCQKFIKQLKS